MLLLTQKLTFALLYMNHLTVDFILTCVISFHVSRLFWFPLAALTFCWRCDTFMRRQSGRFSSTWRSFPKCQLPVRRISGWRRRTQHILGFVLCSLPELQRKLLNNNNNNNNKIAKGCQNSQKYWFLWFEFHNRYHRMTLWSQKLHNNMHIWDLCPVFPPLCELWPILSPSSCFRMEEGTVLRFQSCFPV